MSDPLRVDDRHPLLRAALASGRPWQEAIFIAAMNDFGYQELVDEILAQPYRLNLVSVDAPSRRLDRHILVLTDSTVAEAQLNLKRVPFWAAAGADAYDCQIDHVKSKRAGQRQTPDPRNLNSEVKPYVRPLRAIDID